MYLLRVYFSLTIFVQSVLSSLWTCAQQCAVAPSAWAELFCHGRSVFLLYFCILKYVFSCKNSYKWLCPATVNFSNRHYSLSYHPGCLSAPLLDDSNPDYSLPSTQISVDTPQKTKFPFKYKNAKIPAGTDLWVRHPMSPLCHMYVTLCYMSHVCHLYVTCRPMSHYVTCHIYVTCMSHYVIGPMSHVCHIMLHVTCMSHYVTCHFYVTFLLYM